MSSKHVKGAIGVFDSGVGGLSVLRHIANTLPFEDLIYVADSAHAPYGEKTPEWIEQRSLELGAFLIQNGVKALVVACNTATAAAVPAMRASFSVPVIAMEPAIKPAASMTKNNKIGILATTGTLESARFSALLDRFAQSTEVYTQPCQGWVEAVESGNIQGGPARKVVALHVEPLLAKGVDTLILGCTHFPFLRTLIQDIAGDEVVLIETGRAVAERLKSVLVQEGLLTSSRSKASRTFYTSGNMTLLTPVIERLWGASLEIQPYDKGARGRFQ